jgi:hypothetical protein
MKRMIIKSLSLLLFLLCSIYLYAQRPLPCGGYKIDTVALHKAMDYEARHSANRTDAASTVVIRVYLHILAYSDGSNYSATTSQMQSEFNTLVASYAADNICFIYAGLDVIWSSQLDTNFNANTDNPAQWDPLRVPNCINVFYPQKIKGNNPACQGGCGIGGTSLVIPNTYCLISQGNIGAGQTISHEVGHCLGLLHTFEPNTGKEDINGANASSTGDLITDTPADPYGYTGGCFTTNATGCLYTGTCTDPNGQSNFNPPYTNLMAYWWNGVNTTCYTPLTLTAGQYARVDGDISTNSALSATASPTNVTLGATTLSSGYLMTSAVNTLTTSGAITITATANATLGGQTILLEPGFHSTPAVGGLTLVRTRVCN